MNLKSRGRAATYSDQGIECCLTIKDYFNSRYVKPLVYLRVYFLWLSLVPLFKLSVVL